MQIPEWLMKGYFGILGLVVLVILGVFIFFSIKNPDALRSESFVLGRMALERGFLGDDTSGIVPITGEDLRKIPVTDLKEEDKDGR